MKSDKLQLWQRKLLDIIMLVPSNSFSIQPPTNSISWKWTPDFRLNIRLQNLSLVWILLNGNWRLQVAKFSQSPTKNTCHLWATPWKQESILKTQTTISYQDLVTLKFFVNHSKLKTKSESTPVWDKVTPSPLSTIQWSPSLLFMLRIEIQLLELFIVLWMIIRSLVFQPTLNS